MASGARKAIGAALALVTLTVGAGAACSDITEVPLPPGSRLVVPPPVYRHWWHMTQACAALPGNFDSIEWYVVPGATTIRHDGRDVSGYWSSVGNRIVMAEEVWLSGSLVRHEMLHALLRSGEHPRSEYLERCGGVVVCIDDCISDAGPPPVPPAGTPRVSSDALRLTVELNPPRPDGATYGGYFTLTVLAHNPADHPVIVQLSPSGDAGPPGAFGYAMFGRWGAIGYDDRAWDPEVTVFAAGETKREVFDMTVGERRGSEGVAPGGYVVQGEYDGSSSAPESLVVAP